MLHPFPDDLPTIFKDLITTTTTTTLPDHDKKKEKVEKKGTKKIKMNYIVKNLEKSLGILLDRFINQPDEPSKNMILLYLSTFSQTLFKNNMYNFSKVYQTLFKQIEKCSYLFQGQIYVHLATMMIELDIMNKNKGLFEEFTNKLLMNVSNSNSSKDRAFRQMCVECLIELERNYTGLLNNYDEYIYKICQNECTHVLQSLAMLLLLILNNKVKHLDTFIDIDKNTAASSTFITKSDSANSQSSDSSSLNKVTFQQFNIPEYFFQFKPMQKGQWLRIKRGGSKRVKKFVQQIRKSLSFLIQNNKYFTIWGKGRLLKTIFLLINFSDFPIDVVRSELTTKILYNTNLYLVHLFVIFRRNLKLKSIDRLLEQRLMSQLIDYTSPIYFRNIVTMLIRRTKRLNDIAPYVHDKLITIHTKLLTLVDCLKSFNEIPDSFIDRLLVSLHDYSYFDEKDNKRLWIILDFLYRLLESYPTLKVLILKYLLKMIDKHTCLVLPYVIKFVDVFDQNNKKLGFQNFVLETISKRLNFNDLSFLEYIPLINRIFEQPTFNPIKLLDQINDFVKAIYKKGDWVIGNEVIKSLKIAVKTHNYKVLRKVSSILSFLSNHYKNIDIKDRSYFFFQLINHVTKEKIEYFVSKKFNLNDFADLDYKKKKTNIHEKFIKHFLKLERVYVDRKASRMNEKEDNFNFEDYSNSLKALKDEESPKLDITLHFSIEFEKKIKHIEQIYGITLTFVTLPQFEDIKEITIPYLEREKGFKFRFKINLKPIYPIPGIFKKVDVQFSTKKTAKCASNINPVRITLSDLFLYVPTKVSKLKLFDYLWTDKRCTSSIKILKHSNVKCIKFIQKELSNFVIEDIVIKNKNNNDDDESDDVMKKKVLIFFPPKYHLLLKLKIKQKVTIVKIRTDFFQILAYVDDFFKM